ncbi:MAG: flagellar biosynthetic protein FliO [Phycisphaerales bacterium JB039]
MRVATGLIALVLTPLMGAAQPLGPPAPDGFGLAQPPAMTDSRPGAAQTGARADAASGIEALPLGGARPAESAPLGPAQPGTGVGVGRTVISLAAVVALLAVAAAAYRQWAVSRGGLALALGAGGRAPSGVLEVLARYPVSRGLTLVLLKVDRRVLLLAQSRFGRLGAGASFRPLCEMTDPEEVARLVERCRDEAGESLAGRFRSMLRQFDATDEELAQMDGAEPLRLIEYSEDGDRVELWDTASEPEDPWLSGDPYRRVEGAVG